MNLNQKCLNTHTFVLLFVVMGSLWLSACEIDLIGSAGLSASETPVPTLQPSVTVTGVPEITPTIQSKDTATPSLTPVVLLSDTPNPTQTLLAAFVEVDRQFQGLLKSNIAYTMPKSMKVDETVIVELLISPTISQDVLVTQIVENSDFLTSSAEPGTLTTNQGGEIETFVSEIEITDQMKAVLISHEPNAFIIQDLHDNAVQPISSVEPTKWRWSVTAQEKGAHTLEIMIFQLVRFDDKDNWHEVEAYKGKIKVDITLANLFEWLDLRWVFGIIGSIITAVLIQIILRRFEENRKKKTNVKKRIGK